MIRRFALLALPLALLIVIAGPSQAAADDHLSAPAATPLGTFGGIDYVQYDGTFEGETSTGAFRVPYQISAPADPSLSNETALVEPPHGSAGLGALNNHFRPNFLFSRGFVHAGIGWSTVGARILDPAAAGTFIDGGFHQFGGKTDDEIIVDFARALAVDPEAASMVGHLARRYVTGFSDSSDPILRLIESGRAAGVFDLAVPYIAYGFDPQTALAAGRFGGKVVVVDSEDDNPKGLIDRGEVPGQYRFYVVAGTPHIADPLDLQSIANGTTPATYVPALRAHFLQGHDWVRTGTPPPASTHLRTSHGNKVDRDANGNAISVDTAGQLVPRLPFVELGEAQFVSGFTGSYEDVKTVQGLGFATHKAYVKAFAAKLNAYAKAGYILQEDALLMRQRASLCVPSTYTETYRDHYEQFVAILPCAG
jgi:hypothetical protein